MCAVSTEQSSPVIGVILAGGESRRMGTDKALIEIGGISLLARTCRALQAVCDCCIVVSNSEQAHRVAGAEFALDGYPGKGPLGGIITAMDACGEGIYIAVGCDMPGIQASVIQLLLEQLNSDATAQAAAFETEHGLQPLGAAYRFSAAEALRGRLLEGRLSLRGALAALNTRIIERPLLNAADLHGLCFLNANTPEDLAQLQRLLEP